MLHLEAPLHGPSQSRSPFSNVPFLPDPRADDSIALPLYDSAMGQSSWGPLILGTIASSLLTGLTVGATFYTYKRTNSPVWAGSVAGLTALLFGGVGIALTSAD